MNIEELAKQATLSATDFVEKYGPAAWEIAQTLVCISGISKVAIGIGGLLLAFTGWFVWKKWVNEDNRSNDSYILAVLYSVVSASSGVVIATIHLGNIWTWVQIFAPDLAIAKMALDKLL